MVEQNSDSPSRRTRKKTDGSAAPVLSSVPGVLAADRPLPHNLEAEKAVLAAMLREPKTCGSMAIEKLKDATVFYTPTHREIFSAFSELYSISDENIDVIAMADILKRRQKLEACGGLAGLAELENSIASTYHFEYWCKLVKDAAMLRTMINVCSEGLVNCYEAQQDADAIVDGVENNIYKVRGEQLDNSVIPFKESLTNAFAHIQAVINKQVQPGIPTGFPDFDNFTGGLKPGEMIVVAARPSIGKTAFALNVIRNIVLNKVHPAKVVFFSLEMTDEQISTRMICTEADMSERKFRDGSFNMQQDVLRLTAAVNTLRGASLFIDSTGGLTIAELRAKARRLKLKEGIDLVVIDYLQLMQGKGNEESRQMVVSEISSGIKALAKELKIPVVVLAQLNREVEKGPTSTLPKLSHLRESGAIEQDADIVAFLHRDRDAAKNLPPGQSVEAKLIVEKNRNGETGIIDLAFFPHATRFVNVRYSADDRPEAAAGAAPGNAQNSAPQTQK